MLPSPMFNAVREWWNDRTDEACAASPDPIDHPSLRAMSLRELADVPLEPPPSPAAALGAAPRPRRAVASFRSPGGGDCPVTSGASAR